MLFGWSGCKGLLVWSRSDCRADSICVHVSRENVTPLFNIYIYSHIFKGTSLDPRMTSTWACAHGVHINIHLLHLSKDLNTHWTTHLAPFQTHTGLSECASLLLYSNPVHHLLPRDPQSYPRGLGPALPRPSLLSTNSRIRFGKGSSFLCTVDSWNIPDKRWI